MSDRLINALIDHAPLVAALGVLYWTATPRLLKTTLSNGGGEIVRRIVGEENAKQTREVHEGLTQVRERLAVLETRLTDHIAAGRATG